MNQHILIVEDHLVSSEMLTYMLTIGGFSVSCVYNGQQALNYLEHHHPDLILMDADLPVIDGWQATRLIKQNEETRHIPVMMLSTHVLPEHREQGYKAGCDAFHSKPIAFKSLIESVNDLLHS